MINLKFIMSDSDVYLRDQVFQFAKDLNIKTIKDTETWNFALAKNTSLFGEKHVIHLDLSDKNKLKAFAEILKEKREKDNFEKSNWFGDGLIITSTHATGTKKIEELVKKHDGQVIKKAKPADMTNMLLKELPINNQLKTFLKDYIGEDYQILVTISNQLKHYDETDLENLTLDELITKLPCKPGGVPPWNYVNHMVKGNAKKAVAEYERAAESSHPLVMMTFAKNKIQPLYRVKTLKAAGLNSQEISSIIKEKNIWHLEDPAKRISISTAEYLAKITIELETNLKGTSKADPNLLFKIYIAKVCLAIKNNKSFKI